MNPNNAPNEVLSEADALRHHLDSQQFEPLEQTYSPTADPSQALSELGAVSCDRDQMSQHVAIAAAKELSDQMNSSRINTSRPPVVRQPKNFF